MRSSTRVRREPVDADFEKRVRESFDKQGLMATLGATLSRVDPGEVEIEMPIRASVSQQHGFAHAGAVASIADSACGYAAFSLMPQDAGVLAVEFKINLQAPGAGDRLIARAKVIRAGRTLSICQAEVSAVNEGEESVVAIMTATIMNVRNRPGVQG
jgi:uncharacterized protein (TIGR00369 family)